MSQQTIDNIETAIRAHLADQGDDTAILGDWFIAYSSMKHDANAHAGIAHGIHYTTSDASPHGALGIATLGVQNLTDDLSYPGDDDE